MSQHNKIKIIHFLILGISIIRIQILEKQARILDPRTIEWYPGYNMPTNEQHNF